MKKLFLALMVLLNTFVFASDINIWKNSTLNKILERGELRVGLDPGYMPFEMKDKKGRIIGYDVDMASKMAKEMGVKLTIIPTSFDGIIGGLLSEKFDIIISGMTITQQRNLKVNFADPYVVIGQTILVDKDVAKNIKSYKDLDNEKYIISTRTGVTGEIVARKFFKKAKIITFETEADCVSEVLNGKAHAFIYDQPYNVLFMSDKGKDRLVHLDTPLTYEPLGFAIRKGDPDFLNWLNNFMRQIKEDKLLDFHQKLYEKWLVDTEWLKRVQ
ncbi:amino acid ABC transporter substrate-binding protein [Malaciobacter mytili]|uniref:Amino acid ABC transporter substrate-binding protein n=1 Tax=Malaciobacter mytili LMG 24559 TaxID=1032238 RepID=A0AAX2AGF8_9BACT|nr:transporter substrate-binding domain-containing protein [Malaciobacter mytili]AXH15905.1 amino acid ABC transporter, periplasmic amino acid-binding protein [Malaciobacter mytili LMG 24559]RXI46241.1 amino acid ABC transporter substrate-binding protein [Malaciobacter mytili]RXK15923.1 amino acid ABC transporter substrate-binding protein [Malaciobacter mytili LMG 24559]